MREIILTSSVLITVITLLRRLLRGKISPRLQYALWLLVALRLLLPGTLFTVPVSVTGAADELTAVMEKRLPVPAASGVPDAAPVPPSAPSGTGEGAAAPETAVPQVSKNSRPAANRLVFIWKAGILVTGCVTVVSNLVFYAQLRAKRRRLVLPPEAVTGNLPVYLVEDLPSPCLFGLIHPAIYLNRQATDPAYLTYVLTHERTHFRHGDHVWSVLRGVCVAVHWYNPLVWLAASLNRQDCELACDDGVIWLLGEQQRLDYGTALVRMISPGRPSLLRSSTSMTAGKRSMKERVALIIQRPQMLKATSALVALVMCGAVAVTFGATAKADTGELPEFQEDVSLPSAPRSLTRLSAAGYTHFSGLFSLSVPEDWAGRLLFEEDEDGVRFYDAAAYRATPDESLLLSIYPQAAVWAAVYEQDAVSLEEFNTGGSPYVYQLAWNRAPEYSGSIQTLRDTAADTFRLNAAADVFSRLVHETYQTNLPLAIAYLPYLSWESYQRLYSEEPLPLLTALTDFARSGGMDWGQYHDVMSNRADSAINGSYAAAYRELVWAMYQQDPSQFGSVLKCEYLTGAERDHMLSWFRSAAAAYQDWPELLEFSDEELYRLLGVTELNSVG